MATKPAGDSSPRTSVPDAQAQNLVRFRSYADVRFGPRVHVYAEQGGPSMTKQSFKDECDVNVIMRRYQQTGVLPLGDGRVPRYIDATSADYQEAMFLVADARSAFAELPSALRERFHNDPKRMLEFLEDPRNREEAIKLGLVNAPAPEATPLAVHVVERKGSDPEQSSKGSGPGGPQAKAGPGHEKPKS